MSKGWLLVAMGLLWVALCAFLGRQAGLATGDGSAFRTGLAVGIVPVVLVSGLVMLRRSA